MVEKRALILRTAGTNCERETAHAFRRAGAVADTVHLDEVLDDPSRICDCGILVFPGGFTYGDDLGAGTIVSNRIRRRLLDPLRRFVEGGGLVLGICNGFQILVKTGLLPSSAGRATLTWNDSFRFEERWVLLEAATDHSPFIRKGDRIFCPVAHGEGKFIAGSQETLEQIEAGGQVAFRYVGRDGSPDPEYPHNPNGSMNAIAGICDETGRILGLMPHPERHIEPFHHPRWTREALTGEGDGLKFFRNAVLAANPI